MTESMSVAARRPALSVLAPSRLAAAPTGRGWVANDPLHVTLADLIELLGGDPAAVTPVDAERFTVQRVLRGTTLIHEHDAAERLYVIQSGSFKYVKTGEDGYEHVLSFAWHRDLLGYDGLASARYAFAAVALEDCRVVALPLAGLAGLRRRVPELDALVQSRVARRLADAGAIAEVMAAVSADARLARFLVQLSERMAEQGQSPRRLRLRMSRRDIANHLGLAPETISRSFRVLAGQGWLSVDDREVEILDLTGLRSCARNTRSGAEKPPVHLHTPWACAA